MSLFYLFSSIPPINLYEKEREDSSPTARGSQTTRDRKKRPDRKLSSLIRMKRHKSTDALTLPPGTNTKMKMKKDLAISFYGVDLELLMKRVDQRGREIPTIVESMLNHLEKVNAFHIEGIFRVCGNQDSMNLLIDAMDSQIDVDFDKFNVHVVSNCLKYYFQTLPEPLLTFALSERFISAFNCPNKDLGLLYTQKLVNSLPKCHRDLCFKLTKTMSKITQYKEINKMDNKNIGIILGPLIWRTDETNPDYFTKFLEYSKYTAKIGQYFVKNVDRIFQECSPMQFFLSPIDYIPENENDISIKAGDWVFVIKKSKSKWIAESGTEIGKFNEEFGNSSDNVFLDFENNITNKKLKTLLIGQDSSKSDLRSRKFFGTR